MKHINKIFSVIAVLFIISGCVKKDFDEVPEKIYSVDFVANTTIAELKAMYLSSSLIEEDIIIKGTVISSDEFGNFYEELVLQDSTGGIEIQIDQDSLFKGYPIGRMVYVKCKGLIISDYRGVKQLTYLSNGSSEKMPQDAIGDYLFRSEEGISIEPREIKISELSEENINTLIKLEEVKFIDSDLGKTYADEGADANRYLIDLAESSMIVRTSDYANFADTIIPSGNGSIIGVYGVYDDDKQMYIRGLDDVDMDDPRISGTIVLDEGFDSDLGVFIGYSVTGAQVWGWDTYDSGCAKMSGYDNGTFANEDWLISPAIDLSASSDAILTFTHAVGYLTDWTDGTLQISSDYDGASDPTTNGTWTEITDFTKATSWTFVNSGGIYLTDYIGDSSVYIAFKYRSNASDAMTWEIGSVRVVTN